MSHAVLAGGLGVLMVYFSVVYAGGVAWPPGWDFLAMAIPVVGAVLIAAAAVVYGYVVYVWSHPSKHWIVRTLRAHSPTQPEAVIASINAEVQQSMDAFQRTWPAAARARVNQLSPLT